MKKPLLLLSFVGLLGSSDIATAATATVEENVAGPVGADLKYYVSPHGAHLATVGRRGSRMSVTVDGAEGPRFDEIATPAQLAVDPRPYQLLMQRMAQQGGRLGDEFTIKPVVFSKDGRRHAYVGRRSQQWILVVDGKESLTLPVDNSSGAIAALRFALEFTGPDGKHLIFINGVYGGYEMWVDGHKWPGVFQSGGGGTAGTIDPLVSPDGSRIAGISQISRDKNTVVLDGKDTGYLAGNLAFSADSKNLMGVADVPNGQALLVDGRPSLRYSSIASFFVAPVGNRIVAVASESGPDGATFFLVADGRPVAASRSKTFIETVVFSPDGKRIAAVCGPIGAKYVIIDGKKGQEYHDVNAKLEFSPDSSRLAYLASMSTRPPTHYLVLNETESDAFYALPRYWFSPDGKRIAVAGQLDAGGRQDLVIDGKTVPLPPRTAIQHLAFSPDGQRYAFIANGDGNAGAVFLDGKATDLTGNFTFSPDGKNFAVVGYGATGGKRGVFVNGECVHENERLVRFRAFTPDSRHLLWVGLEPSKAPNAEPGSYEWVTYVDGEPTARSPKSPASDQIFGLSVQPHVGDNPGWQLGAAGELAVIGPAESEVKRLRIKPGASTNIDTMIAEAKDLPRRAAAKAAEEKRLADEAAAAKRAKAQADAAEAAAKAKADYDAALAKRQADYNAALAKRKADYDAAIAKQKADYDALMAKRKADAEAAAAARKK